LIDDFLFGRGIDRNWQQANGEQCADGFHVTPYFDQATPNGRMAGRAIR
jgi:hypothetical protein